MKYEIDSFRTKTVVGREASVLGKRIGAVCVAAFLAAWWACASVLPATLEDAKPGAWAKYKMLSTFTYRGEKPPLDTVTLSVGPTEVEGGKPYRWWEMQCAKTGGGSFAIRVLSENLPSARARGIGRVARYILREEGENPLAFVNAETGRALLPQVSFPRYLLPKPLPSATMTGLFPEQATLLGQMLVLHEWSNKGEFPIALEPGVLKLNPGLLVGTGRNFRDTLDHRITGDDDYPYQRFTKEEYDEMIEAGINYFTVDPEQAEWVRRRPVFYELGDLKRARFPEILYRSNFWGAVQFVDEPGVYVYGDEDAKKDAKRPADLAELLSLRVRRTMSTAGGYSSMRLEQALRDAGFNLGFMKIVEPDIPIWEAAINTSFYQLRSGVASGILDEGRYRLDEFRGNLKKIVVDADSLGEKEMLLIYFGIMRGAARAWGKDWGTSIYGQADPAISPRVVSLAYDLGARYIWYWTSDHQHHMPYREQLELTRHLRSHEKAHPRKSRDKLLRGAEVAIALPHGYVLDWGPLWGSNAFAHDKLNEVGVPYGNVVKAALREALACLKEEKSFDFVVDSPGFKPKGYKRVIRIRLDGAAENGLN